jgi:hypothetical protein
MTRYMERAGRVKDILLFLHRNYLVNGQWVSVGEYARFARVSKSPHLRQIFAQLCAEKIITFQDEPYKATIARTFAIDYESVTKLYPHIRQILMEIGWQESLL